MSVGQSQVVLTHWYHTATARSKLDRQLLNIRVSRGRKGAGAIVSVGLFFVKHGLQEPGPQRSDYSFDPSERPGKGLIFTSVTYCFQYRRNSVSWRSLLLIRGLCIENTKVLKYDYVCVYTPGPHSPESSENVIRISMELFAFRLETVHQAVPSPSPNLLVSCFLGLWKPEGHSDGSINSLRVRAGCKLVCDYRHIWVSVSPEPIFQTEKSAVWSHFG